MGKWLSYICNKCEYYYRGSAGFSCGTFSVVETFVCNKCNTLSDVIIGEIGNKSTEWLIPYSMEEIKAGGKKIKCGNCRSKDISLWESGKKPCPVEGCKGIMKADPSFGITLWD